ncbi:MAG TPA: hypothetical protein VF447_16880 [Terriglobales bacterium]
MRNLKFHKFGRAAPISSESPIVMLVVGEAGLAVRQNHALALHWQGSAPDARFLGLELDPLDGRQHLAETSDALIKTAHAYDVPPSRLILFGSEETGRLALDLALQKPVCCGGFVGFDIPLRDLIKTRLVLPRIRLVQRSADADAEDRELQEAIATLRGAQADLRAMSLPGKISLESKPVIKACGGFLMELIALASEQA